MNIGVTLYIIKKSTKPRSISATKNIVLIVGLMIKHITILHIIISGALTAILRSIWYAFCTLVTSVVIRVIRPAVLYLSILENAKFCILVYIPSLKLQAKPVDALAAYFPA